MKLNWGAGIALLYSGFVVMILVLIGMSASQKIDLVTDHYYEEELQFQNKIDKIKRTELLAEQLTWAVHDKGLLVHFPQNTDKNSISGKIRLYCPSNNKNDRIFKITSKNKEQLVSFGKIPKGKYHLHIDWKKGDQTYWNEDVITVKH